MKRFISINLFLVLILIVIGCAPGSGPGNEDYKNTQACYDSLGDDVHQKLGAPMYGFEIPCQNGEKALLFEHGGVFLDSKQNTDSCFLLDNEAIYQKYQSLGVCLGELGNPIHKIYTTQSRPGSYMDFTNGAIYTYPTLGTYAIYGPIFKSWDSMNRESGDMGYPTSDIFKVPDNDSYGNKDTNRGIFHGGFIDQQDGEEETTVSPKSEFFMDIMALDWCFDLPYRFPDTIVFHPVIANVGTQPSLPVYGETWWAVGLNSPTSSESRYTFSPDDPVFRPGEIRVLEGTSVPFGLTNKYDGFEYVLEGFPGDPFDSESIAGQNNHFIVFSNGEGRDPQSPQTGSWIVNDSGKNCDAFPEQRYGVPKP